MKLFYFYNDDFKSMLDMFSDSFRDDWELFPVKTNNFSTKLHAGGRKGDYLRKYLIDYAIRNTGPNEIFIMCDIDIYFYKPLIPCINYLFSVPQIVKIGSEENKKYLDIIFQKETRWKECNMGVMAMKNNNTVINFWNKVYYRVFNQNKWDQPIMNDVLYENLNKKTDLYSNYKNNNDIVWHTFPTNIWNMSLKKNDPFIEPPKDIILHHANCCITQKDKIDQINNIKNYLLKNYSLSEIETSKIIPKFIKEYYLEI